MPRFLPCLCAAMFFSAVSIRAADEKGFTFQDTAGQYLDVLLDGKIAVRYMYAHDVSTPEKRVETFKPYLHVFDADGKGPITKGPGGLFPHHRAIFIGWNQVGYNGKKYDLWHMKETDIIHQKFSEQKGETDKATFTSLVNWVIEKDKTLLEEERTFIIKRGPAPARITIDFISKIKASLGDVELNGDPEHAGIHYRPANELDTKVTTYLYPVENADAHKDLDYPWVGMQYTLAGKTYSVAEINPASNPKGTKWSAYRDYGRFGAFPKQPIKSGESFTFKYRFIIADGEMMPVDFIQKSADEFAGATTPTPLPKTTAKISEQPKPKAPGAADPKAKEPAK